MVLLVHVAQCNRVRQKLIQPLAALHPDLLIQRVRKVLHHLAKLLDLFRVLMPALCHKVVTVFALLRRYSHCIHLSCASDAITLTSVLNKTPGPLPKTRPGTRARPPEKRLSYSVTSPAPSVRPTFQCADRDFDPAFAGRRS